MRLGTVSCLKRRPYMCNLPLHDILEDQSQHETYQLDVQLHEELMEEIVNEIKSTSHLDAQ
jgi:hypothetical protein